MIRVYLSEGYGPLALSLRGRLLSEGFQLRVWVERRAELPLDALRLESCLTVPDDPEALAASLSACALAVSLPTAAERRLTVAEQLTRRHAFVDALDLLSDPLQLIYVVDPLFEEELTLSSPPRRAANVSSTPSWCRHGSPAARIAERAAEGAPYTLVRLAELYTLSSQTGRLLPLSRPLYSGDLTTSWMPCEAAVEALLVLWLRGERGRHTTIAGQDLRHEDFQRCARSLGHSAPRLASGELAFAKRRLYLSLDSIGLLSPPQQQALQHLTFWLSPRPLSLAEDRAEWLPPPPSLTSALRTRRGSSHKSR